MTDRHPQCAFEHSLGNAHSHITQNQRTLPHTLDRTLGLKALANRVLCSTKPRTLSAHCNVQPTGQNADLQPIGAHYKTAISDWLRRIDENDPEIIFEVIRRCETDPEARTYFLTRANEAQI